jgi:hypothetical protein
MADGAKTAARALAVGNNSPAVALSRSTRAREPRRDELAERRLRALGVDRRVRPDTARSFRLGAGRSQVQILSLRLEHPANRVLLFFSLLWIGVMAVRVQLDPRGPISAIGRETVYGAVASIPAIVRTRSIRAETRTFNRGPLHRGSSRLARRRTRAPRPRQSSHERGLGRLLAHDQGDHHERQRDRARERRSRPGIVLLGPIVAGPIRCPDKAPSRGCDPAGSIRTAHVQPPRKSRVLQANQRARATLVRFAVRVR